MILAILGLLGAVFSVTSGVTDASNYLHEHPLGQLAPGSNEWKAACADAFKSFDPDNGWYVGYDGKHHPCRIQIVHKW